MLGLLILSLGPFPFNKIMAFIKGQKDAIKVQPLQIHYHWLEMVDLRDGYVDILPSDPWVDQFWLDHIFSSRMDWLASDGQLRGRRRPCINGNLRQRTTPKKG